jgi:hypothetical protein
MSFMVWLHHFFTMGAGADVNAILGIATMIIAVPTGVVQLAVQDVWRSYQVFRIDVVVDRIHGDIHSGRNDRRVVRRVRGLQL